MNSYGPQKSILPSNLSRFWDWDLFCLADQYGFGFTLITLRSRRQNGPSPLPPKKYDVSEIKSWCNKLFVGMVYERRVSNSRKDFYIQTDI